MGTKLNIFVKNSVTALLILFNVLVLVSAYTYQPECEDNLVRNTKYGPVKGSKKFSRGRREFHSFTGIPYAKPPVGRLRFANPEPVEPWNSATIYNATQEPATCIQRNYLVSNNPPIEGQEDCLYINLFVPKIESRSRKLLPVLVFIHWGGFFTGRSTTGYLGPEFFMDKDIILVTFNYRLGPFGFLSTLDDESPGNFALKDQVLALKWIQENIQYFGGDKQKVTISGQSAGAASVHYHMMSPSSKGLFSQGISQSGSALDIWAYPSNVTCLQASFAQALFVGCPNTTDTSVIIDCLRNVPADTIMQTQDYFKTFFGDPVTAYSVVTERQTKTNPNPFITKTPVEYIQAGEVSNVPWIVGTVQDEGMVRAASRIRSKDVRDALNANFSSVLSNILGFGLTSANPTELYKSVIRQYLGGREYVNVSDPSNVQGFIDLYSDRIFVYGVYQTIILAAASGNKNIFMYSFNYRGANTYGDYFATTSEDINFNWGTSHCDELIYLFQSPDFFPPLKGNDILMSNILVDLWTNFVTHGTPSYSQNASNFLWYPLKPIHLGSMENTEIQLLNITGNINTGPEFHSSHGFYADRMSFWQKSV